MIPAWGTQRALTPSIFGSIFLNSSGLSNFNPSSPFFSPLIFSCLRRSASAVFTAITRCSVENIEAYTVMHDDLIEEKNIASKTCRDLKKKNKFSRNYK